MRKIYSLVIALVVFLSITLSAVAFEQKTNTRENAEYGEAFWSSDNPPLFGILIVSKNISGTSIDMIAYTAEYSLSGSIETQNNVFNVDNKFQSATLTAPMWLSICDPDMISCEKAEGKIQAEWTGYGELQRGKDQSISHSDGDLLRFSDIFSHRKAIATMSITIGEKKQQFGNSVEAGLGKAKTVSMNFSK